MKLMIMDGAMGTTISNIYNNTETCREKLNISNPDLIMDIHKRYALAGADYLKANTFNCSEESLTKYGENPTLAYDYAFHGGKLCKEMSQKYGKKSIGTFCLGDIPQIDGILDSDVDIIMIETIFNFEKGLETLKLLKNRMNKKNLKKPLMISFAVNKEGKLYSGENLLDIYKYFIQDDVMSIGINCSEFSPQILAILKDMKKNDIKVSFHPNSTGDATKFLNDIKLCLDKEVIDIIGGCCGTDFNHIEKLHNYLNS